MDEIMIPRHIHGLLLEQQQTIEVRRAVTRASVTNLLSRSFNVLMLLITHVRNGSNNPEFSEGRGEEKRKCE